ncbi:hypothetical protein RPALISO_239 [Ruegeria phage RpAliso]|nr:hypothetical protein RPALISO_239 [Ruegeria phage RpAliso]
MENRPAFATYKGLRIFNTFLGARRAARKAQGPVIGYIMAQGPGDAFPTACRIVSGPTLAHTVEEETVFDPYAIKAGD